MPNILRTTEINPITSTSQHFSYQTKNFLCFINKVANILSGEANAF